jgi:spermidine synthase
MIRHVLLLVLFVALLPHASFAQEKTEKVLFEKNSVYQYISVVEDTAKKERYIINTKRDYQQGGISEEDPSKLIFEYTRIAFISLAFLDGAPKDALFVGLGAGSMPRYFNQHYPDVDTDVVEIDPDIFNVAKRFFYFKETPNMKVHISDGRRFIKRTNKKYDIIFLDAYQNDFIPFHLTTAEFLKELKRRLKKDGVVVSNIASPFRNKFYDSMLVTYLKEFPQLYIFKGTSRNSIFVATMNEKKKSAHEISRRAEEIQKARKLDIDLARIGWSYDWDYSNYKYNGKVLTDDFAPVNLYRQMTAE